MTSFWRTPAATRALAVDDRSGSTQPDRHNFRFGSTHSALQTVEL